MFRKKINIDDLEIALKELEEKKQKKEKQDKCEHKNFSILGHNLIGYATCLDCGYRNKAYIFQNLLNDRLIKLANEYEKRLGI